MLHRPAATSYGWHAHPTPEISEVIADLNYAVPFVACHANERLRRIESEGTLGGALMEYYTKYQVRYLIED